MILNAVIIPPSGYNFATPCLPIVGVIFWIMNEEIILSDYHLFLLGLLNDLIFGTPLGISSILYFLIKTFLNFAKKTFKTFRRNREKRGTRKIWIRRVR